MNDVIVSIICPLYKGGKYVNDIIRMVNENYKDIQKKKIAVEIELIFVNDCPSETISINSSAKNFKVTLITNDENRGIHYSRIRGLNNCIGEYVLFLDQDDEISYEYIGSQITSIGNADAVICNGKNRGCKIYINEKMLQNACKKDDYYRGRNPIVSPGQVLVKRGAIPIEWSEYSLKNNGADDYFLWLLLFVNGRNIVCNNKNLYVHNTTGVNTSNDWKKMKMSIAEMVDRLYNLNLMSKRQIQNIEEGHGIFDDNSAEIEIRYERSRKIASILDIWLTHKENGRTCTQYMKDNRYDNVIVYGYGILGRHLVYELKECGIHIEGIMDINTNIGEEDIHNLKIGDSISNMSVIIVTPVCGYGTIYEKLKRIYENTIIHISEIIDNMK